MILISIVNKIPESHIGGKLTEQKSNPAVKFTFYLSKSSDRMGDEILSAPTLYSCIHLPNGRIKSMSHVLSDPVIQQRLPPVSNL